VATDVNVSEPQGATMALKLLSEPLRAAATSL
jgi:hypothetical protein